MHPKDKLEYIRQACIKANPSIKDLVFGCQIRQKFSVKKYVHILCEPSKTDEGDEYIYTTHGHTAEKVYIKRYTPTDNYILEIIGRECRLADVLLAMTKVYNERDTIDDSRNYHKNGKIIPLSDFFAEICCLYNLTQDNLELQSEETRSFIYELLK